MIPATECAPENAKLILTADKDYYYDVLNSDVVSMANAYSGDVTIKLVSDIAIPATLAFSKASGAVTLDLNGYTMNNGGTGSMIDVAEGTNLTVKNGYITNTAAVTVITANNATLTLEKVMLRSDSTSSDSAVAAIDASGTVLTIKGSGIYQKSKNNYDTEPASAFNGAIRLKTVADVEDTLTIEGSVIYNGGFRVIRLENGSTGDVVMNVTNSVLAAADANSGHALLLGYPTGTAALIINGETVATITSGALTLTEGSGGSTTLTQYAYTYTFPGDLTINPYKAGLWGTAPTLTIPFVVAYNPNGGTSSIDDQHSLDGTAVAALDADGLAYADHVFVGWNTAADGTGTAYLVGNDVNAGTTLYAQWCEWFNAETADSVVKVETNGTTYYSDMLHSAVVAQVVDFGGTITLLKDYTLTQKVEFPASWDTAKAIVIDLDGHTITHVAGITGSATAVRGLFTVLGGGDLTLKNGTVISTEDNSLVSLGWKGAENNLGGVPYLPKLTLDNMQMKQECEEINNCAMIISKNYKADITILNSTLWTLNNGTNAHFSVLIMDGLADDYTSVLEIHDSVLGGPNVELVIRTDATGFGHKLELNTSNTKYVSSTGYIWREAASELTATANGSTLTANKAGSEASVDATLEENWSYTHDVFGELTGKATIYGIAAVKNETTGGKYYSLAKALAAAGNGETILLQKNIGGAPLVINTSITLNFDTFTYTVNTAGDSASALTVANGTTVTLKNGALAVDEAVASYFDTLIENQGADITIDTMTLSGANLDANAQVTDGYVSYVLANHNGGTVTIAGATNISANTKGTGYAFDVCSGTTVSVTTTGNINGYITVDKASGAKLTIESGTYDKALDNSWLKAGMVPTSNAAGTTFTVAEGTISNAGSSLSLNEWVHINQYVTFDETLAANVSLKDAGSGLLVWIGDTKIGDTAHNAANTVPFVVLNDGKYIAQSTDIDTPEYGKTVFMRAYVELADGSYAYGPVKEYSVRQYCNNMLAGSVGADVKALCAALLNFGAASQTYFVRDTDALANAGVEYPVNAYSAEMVKELATIVNNIGTEEITIETSMSLDAEIFYNFYIDATLASDTAPELYIWSGDTTTLTDKNYSKKVTMVLNQNGAYYHAQSDGFSSNEYNDTIFVAVKIGDTFYAAQGFSVANSAKKVIERVVADPDEEELNFKALCRAMIVYGNYAEAVFG